MTATRYRAPPASDVSMASLDELVAIFHRASGITHLVVPPVAELLVAIAGRWVTLDNIEHEFELVEEDRQGLISVLNDLAVAGLIERA